MIVIFSGTTEGRQLSHALAAEHTTHDAAKHHGAD